MERHVELHKPRKTGGKNYTSLYRQCRQVERQTGKWPEVYQPLEPPDGSEFFWQTFWELRNHSGMGFSGPENLSFHDIEAWQRVRDFRLGNWAVDIILEMDAAYMRQWREMDKKDGY